MKILRLITSVMGDHSYSKKLGNTIVEKILEKYPNSQLEEVDLSEMNIPHLNSRLVQAMFTPAEHQTEETVKLVEYSNYAVKQLMQSDILVIDAPLYNFTIPSTLKAWIDHITRAGITFGYGSDGRPIGMVTGKKVYVAMTSGGIFSEGPGKENDFVAPYLKSFLGFLGMTNLTVFRAEGLKVPGVMETAYEKAVASISID